MRGLASALRERSDVSVVELGGGRYEPPGTLRRKLLTAGLDFAWYPALLRSRTRAVQADVLHCPAPRGPFTRGSPPLVVTVHDLVPFRFPETMTRWSLLYARATHRSILAAADRIICNSVDTADDLVAILGLTRDRIRVIHLGVDAHFFQPEPNCEPPREPYVLFVGTQEPRKNLERLEHAVGILRARGFPHTLAVAGGSAWGNIRLNKPFVRNLGDITDSELRQLYARAACLALPSLHEGFGLPALEAMAAGTPVVAANSGALPEITGGAAIMVDPLDAENIARGLEIAIRDTGAIREAGRKRASLFTWHRAAEESLAVYREIA